MSSDPALKPEGPLDKLTGSLSTSTNQGPGIFKEGWAGTAETGKAGGEPGDTRYVKNPVTAETASGKGSGSSTENDERSTMESIKNKLSGH